VLVGPGRISTIAIPRAISPALEGESMDERSAG
jgi:hypothetical protein